MKKKSERQIRYGLLDFFFRRINHLVDVHIRIGVGYDFFHWYFFERVNFMSTGWVII